MTGPERGAGRPRARLPQSDEVFVRNAITPYIGKFCDWNIHPNVVTAISLILSAAIPFLDSRRLAWAVVAAMVLRQILDCLDGEIARRCGKVTRAGGLLDTVADCVFFFALIWIVVSRLAGRPSRVFPYSALAFGGLFVIHLSICRASAFFDHTVKVYDTPSIYRRAFAVMANNSLLLVGIAAALYLLGMR